MFVAVVEYRSFSRAAMQLHRSNSILTDTVVKLEKHRGVWLLNRTTRQVLPTCESGQYYGVAVLVSLSCWIKHAASKRHHKVPEGLF